MTKTMTALACRLVASACTLMAATLLLATIDASAAHAQSNYPNRPIRLVAPFAPGGPVDVGARLLAPKLQDALGAQVYVENMPGGSGNIGTAVVAKAAPDGYTVLVISSSFVVNPSMFKLSYDAEKDLAPVSLVGLGPQVILVHPSVPATNMKELIALVKANPGKYSFGSAGTGSPGYLAGVMLNHSFGIDLQHVPFQGGGPAVTSTVGGHTPMVITTISSAAGHIQSGALRALATTGAQRSPALPNVPTLAEQGIRDQESDVILGVLVPRETPKPIVDRLHGEIVKIVAQPEMKEKLAVVGFDAVGSTPAEFEARIRSEIAKWAKVIRAAGMTPQ
jgi:tripartite-type tricarboxylate transporter receptor subunit TctC